MIAKIPKSSTVGTNRMAAVLLKMALYSGGICAASAILDGHAGALDKRTAFLRQIMNWELP